MPKTIPVFQLLYVSSATKQLDETALLGILAESQKRNAEKSITGLLLHSDGNIIQIIEGEEADVEKLFAKIECDERHRNVTALSRKFVDQRDFPEYKMGFKRASPHVLSQNLPGFPRIIEDKKLPQATLDETSKLVSTFLKTFSKTTRMEG